MAPGAVARFGASLDSGPPMIPRVTLACTKPARAGKRRRSRSTEHDVRVKQARACDAERAWFRVPTHASNVSCDSKDEVRAGIGAKRNLVTSPALLASYQLLEHRRATDCSGSDCLQQPFPDGKSDLPYTSQRHIFQSKLEDPIENRATGFSARR